MTLPTYTCELELLKTYQYVAGVDEAGRGPLAGPVVAAAVILNPDKIGKYRSKSKWWQKARDSKLMTQKQRQSLIIEIKNNSLAYGIGISSHKHIDELNIHHATLRAMRQAIEWCAIEPDFVLIDGCHTIPNMPCGQKAIVNGDARILSIAAASIIAKVARDAIMTSLRAVYPEYGFDRHKGYATSGHRAVISQKGLCPIHRKSFFSRFAKLI